jgi:adenosylmethionine-8-amino-7-oxononanoate aminotransferase
LIGSHINGREHEGAIKTINLKSDMPLVREALQRLERELALARQSKITLLKFVHGYGSTGAGGEIRIAVQKRLLEMMQCGQIRACIFGENWSKTDDAAWKLLQAYAELKNDSDLGRRNQGITIVVL